MSLLRRSTRERKRKTYDEVAEFSDTQRASPKKYQRTDFKKKSAKEVFKFDKHSRSSEKNKANNKGLLENNNTREDAVKKEYDDSDSDEQEIDDDDDDEGEILDDNGLSAYELQRLENIRTNEQFFKDLNLNQAKTNLKLATTGETKLQKKYGLKREKKPKEPPPPRRASMRIRKLDPLGTPLPEVPKDEQASLSEQFRQVRYYSKPLARYGLEGVKTNSSGNDYNQRKPSGPLEMTTSNNIEGELCKKAIQHWFDLSMKYAKKQIAVEEHHENKLDLEEYHKQIAALTIEEHHAAKITPNRIFSLAIHPMESKLLVIAGSKWGRIGIWDVDSNEGQDGVYLFEPHTRPINVVSICPLDHTKVYSCSYDGTLRCGDLEKQLFTEVYAEAEDDDVSFNAFAWVARSDQMVVIGKSDYTVGVIDIRTGKEEQNFVAHGKLVRWVDCHPVNEHLISTCCQDGSVATWDLRKTTNIKSKLSEIKCSRVASSAFFSPKTGNKILTTSLDDTIRVYDVNVNGALQSPAKCLIRHNNQTGRWLTKFRATWDPKTDDCFVVGSMARPRAVDFYTSNGNGSRIAQISHENLSSITSLNVFHPTLNIVAGGNSSGKAFVWK